jgi:hypothetical protein
MGVSIVYYCRLDRSIVMKAEPFSSEDGLKDFRVVTVKHLLESIIFLRGKIRTCHFGLILTDIED